MNVVTRGVGDYLKCVYKNRFTLAGYVLAAISFTIGYLYFYQWPYLALWVLSTVAATWACFLLTVTFFGLQTLYHYRRAKRILEKRSEISLPQGREYCSQVGIGLAVEENNQLLKASSIQAYLFRSKWRRWPHAEQIFCWS